MKTLTLGNILRNYQEHLTKYELENLKDIQKRPTDFATQVRELHLALFGEEFDFMTDSRTDSKDRKQGKNPMSSAYTERVNKKREAFGIPPLDAIGFAMDNSSIKFCEEVVRQTKNYKELLELKRKNGKQIVFVDMDNVLVDFQSGIDRISKEERATFAGRLDEVPGIFALMDPYEGAIDSYRWLSENFDTYILSTAPWENPSAWHDKLLWVKKHLPEVAYKRLILSHNKHLVRGDFLIDDRTANGAGKFPGKHIHFGEKGKGFEDWKAVRAYLKNFA
ncbi:5' nucleotidase, NT5C type [Arenibacter lacus]|uniref:5' nucleotidase, NT5C type n=1 Tax=Arenibacter lacus TaxID=2608629 RepID=UPI001CC4BFA0|nr:hypothetical protein [Arenibacter lacus]